MTGTSIIETRFEQTFFGWLLGFKARKTVLFSSRDKDTTIKALDLSDAQYVEVKSNGYSIVFPGSEILITCLPEVQRMNDVNRVCYLLRRKI